MILVDSTFTSRGFGGIAQDNRDFEVEFRKYLHTFFLYDKNVSNGTNNEIELHSSMRKINAGAIALNKTLKMLDWQGDYFQTHLTGLGYPNKSGRIFLRLHDIFPITNPEWFTWQGRKIFSLGAAGLSGNTVLVCNSKTTQRFAQKNPIFSKFETLVVPCKVKKEGDISTPCNSCDYCSKGGPITEFLLAVGTVEPRKNYDRLIQGWKKSRSNSSFRNLVIVGRPGWKSYQTQKKIYNDSSIIWISPCDYGLSHLFRTASAFISASLAEGFDIPSVNAEFYGIPSALSAIDAHFEFCKSAKVFFDPNSVNEVHLAINRLSAESRSDGFRPLDIDWQRDFHQLAKRIGIEKNLKA